MRVLALLTSGFPVWVLICSVLALYRPEFFTWFRGPMITVGLGVIMLGMGITLNPEDFKRIPRYRKPIALGVLFQYVLMPMLGWGLSHLFGLSNPLAVGLILVASCPGGTASNVITFLARANLPLSVSMTAVSTLLAVFMTPTLAVFLTGSRVEVPALGLFISTLQVVVFPIALGASMSKFFPALTRRVLPVAPLAAVIMITLIVASIIGDGRQAILMGEVRLLFAVFFLHALGFLLGYLATRIIRGSRLTARTIAIEVGMQNSGLGVVLARQNFADPLIAIPSAISSLFHSLIGSFVAGVWERSFDDLQSKDDEF